MAAAGSAAPPRRHTPPRAVRRRCQLPPACPEPWLPGAVFAPPAVAVHSVQDHVVPCRPSACAGRPAGPVSSQVTTQRHVTGSTPAVIPATALAAEPRLVPSFYTGGRATSKALEHHTTSGRNGEARSRVRDSVGHMSHLGSTLVTWVESLYRVAGTAGTAGQTRVGVQGSAVLMCVVCVRLQQSQAKSWSLYGLVLALPD